MKLNVLIADDELVARKRLSRLLSALPDVALVGECQDGGEVLETIRAGDIDVVLLDIAMPGLSGLEVSQLVQAADEDGPRIIFCTAHADHAVEAFDAGAVDYLLKPIEPARLLRALERVRSRTRRTVSTAPPLERLALPTRKGIVLLDPRQVSHALLENELVTLHTDQGEFLCDFTLQELEERLPGDRFERVHRRALVNLEQVVRLEPTDTGGYLARMTRGEAVEVSRQAARDLRRRLGLR